MITAIVGGLGSGKTATLSAMALAYYSQGNTIYSNYNLYFPSENGDGNKPFSILVKSNDDLDKVKKGYFMGDELWSWIDSRMSTTHANRFVSDILLKSRKRGFNLIFTAQSFHQIDKRIRDITDYIIAPHVMICKDNEILTIKQSILKPISVDPLLSYSFVRANVISLATKEIIDMFEFNLEPITKIYDTTEEVEILSKSENMKDVDYGIEEEKIFKTELEKLFPNAQTILIPDSGKHRKDTFDVEMLINDTLLIFDVTTLDPKKYKGKINYYMILRDKKIGKYKGVEKKRKAVTYFAYKFDDIFYIAPSLKVIELAKGHDTIPLKIILPESVKITELKLNEQ